MPTVEQIAVERLKAGLDAMAASRVIKKHYLTPKAIFQTPECPWAYFRLSADDDYARDDQIGGDTAGFRVGSRLLLTYAIRREANYIAKELADMNALMRAMVYEYVKDPGCNLQVVRMTTYTDPYMGNLYDEYGMATLAINYIGRDILRPALEAEMAMMHYDTTEYVYAGAPARQVMKSFPIPGGILVDKKVIQITAQGRLAANSQSKTIAVNLGPNPIADVADSAGNSNGGWIVNVRLTWKSVTECVGTMELQFINSSGTVTKDYHFPYISPVPPFDFIVYGESQTDGNITAQQLVAYLIG
jgi:hypothetical protein